MKQRRKQPVRKWERVLAHLRAYEADHKIEDALDALAWVHKWPNDRSRDETALSTTVARTIRRRIIPETVPTHDARKAAATLADLIAREARVRVVAAVRRRAKGKPSDVLGRYIAKALMDAIRRLK